MFAQRAFGKGINVITEKPLAVTAHDGQATIDAFESARKDKPELIFAGMFQQRTFATWSAVKRLCTDGSVGDNEVVPLNENEWYSAQGKLTLKLTDLMKLKIGGNFENREFRDYDHVYKFNPDGDFQKFQYF